jgi:hypothetical protein
VADADDRMLISRRILDAAYRLDGLRMAESPAPASAGPAGSAGPTPELWQSAAPPVVDIASLDYDDPVVPIEMLLYEAPVVPIESLAYDEPAPVPGAGGLEASYRTFDRLRRERGAQSPSLEVLVGRALAEVAPAPSEGTVTIEIGALCYRGRAALERAAAVRQQLADELARNGGLEAIQPLLQELLDLVPLALAES